MYKIRLVGTPNMYLTYDKSFSPDEKFQKIYKSENSANKVAEKEREKGNDVEVLEFSLRNRKDFIDNL